MTARDAFDEFLQAEGIDPGLQDRSPSEHAGTMFCGVLGARGYDVEHGDGVTMEVARRLPYSIARRLVDHEISAGRIVTMQPTPEPKGHAR